ncbi:aspartate kinase [Nonlabens tegetincola]|uniref:aspartate kinase n=1 Tax=Nonlabens tegetincola TaxID=323273 RepID=UPI000A205B76|nr:aspartate kinase [Nonlabens tegetincola]ARN72451.1 aspartate kinase [Nonlabens tegetincola]
MRIFKFGGASVKDANGVRNVVNVLRITGFRDLGVVVSAMGKTTNALEEILARYQKNDNSYLKLIDKLYEQHNEVIVELEEVTDFINEDEVLRFRESGIKNILKGIIEALKGELLRNKTKNYSFLYDQVVSHGELISTKIVAAFLNACNIPVQWVDARELIKTDTKYRDAGVQWQETENVIKNISGSSFLTQGFIGSDDNGFTTTLGREGSDYTAAILAYCLDAESVTIWKDVPGVLNADPRVFHDTVLLEKIPYNEAIELAFYGASVIHPKTLQPLQRKSIPLRVKSFLNPKENGSTITHSKTLLPEIPCYIVRKNLIFLRVSSRDFSFIGEGNISEIFHELSEAKMQVGLLQNSAISFSICVEDKYSLINVLLSRLQERYDVSVVKNVALYTIRHYNGEKVASIENEQQVLLKQRTQETLQVVVKQ